MRDEQIGQTRTALSEAGLLPPLRSAMTSGCTVGTIYSRAPESARDPPCTKSVGDRTIVCPTMANPFALNGRKGRRPLQRVILFVAVSVGSLAACRHRHRTRSRQHVPRQRIDPDAHLERGSYGLGDPSAVTSTV